MKSPCVVDVFTIYHSVFVLCCVKRSLDVPVAKCTNSRWKVKAKHSVCREFPARSRDSDNI